MTGLFTQLNINTFKQAVNFFFYNILVMSHHSQTSDQIPICYGVAVCIILLQNSYVVVFAVKYAIIRLGLILTLTTTV